MIDLEPEEKTSIEEMAKQIEADLTEPDESQEDQPDLDFYFRDVKQIEEALTKAQDPDTDPLVAFFLLKRCIRRDIDLVSLNYWHDFQVIPLLHENLERILSQKEFDAVNKKFLPTSEISNESLDGLIINPQFRK